MDETLTPDQWYELQGRIRKLYPELTDADLQYHEAVEQDLLAMIAFSLRKTKEIVQEIVGKQNALSFPGSYWRYQRKRRTMHKSE